MQTEFSRVDAATFFPGVAPVLLRGHIFSRPTWYLVRGGGLFDCPVHGLQLKACEQYQVGLATLFRGENIV